MDAFDSFFSGGSCRAQRGSWGQGCPTGKKGGQDQPITLIAIQTRPSKHSFCLAIKTLLQNSDSYWICFKYLQSMWLNFWCVWHGFAWFGMIYYGLVSVWSISSKSQFCSWPLIAPPPCVVSLCGWNGPGTPSNITATWLLNFTLYAWNNLCNKCIHQFVWGKLWKDYETLRLIRVHQIIWWDYL